MKHELAYERTRYYAVWKRLSLFAFFIAAALMTFAQGRVVGKVQNETGGPVSGASVSVKGTNTGTTTDNSGNFSINANPGTVLVISYVGYLTQEVNVTGAELSVQLAVDARSMGEVIVVGYGSQRRRDVTGAVISVNEATLKEVPAPNVLNQLKGRAAGVSIVSNGATPGSQA